MADSGEIEYETNGCREYVWMIKRNILHAPPPNQRREWLTFSNTYI